MAKKKLSKRDEMGKTVAGREKLLPQTVRKPKPPPSVAETQSRAKQCAFCKHWYLNPCTDKTAPSCPNYLHLQKTKPPGAKGNAKTSSRAK